MPTYEYRCRDCGHEFEIVQSMKDDTLTVCPNCGGRLRKVFGAPMISFKGSGFYATDHGKKSKSSERAAEQKDAKQGGDSTPAPAGDSKGGSEKKGGDSGSAEKSGSGSKTESPETKSSGSKSEPKPKSEPKTSGKKEPST